MCSSYCRVTNPHEFEVDGLPILGHIRAECGGCIQVQHKRRQAGNLGSDLAVGATLYPQLLTR